MGRGRALHVRFGDSHIWACGNYVCRGWVSYFLNVFAKISEMYEKNKQNGITYAETAKVFFKEGVKFWKYPILTSHVDHKVEILWNFLSFSGIVMLWIEIWSMYSRVWLSTWYAPPLNFNRRCFSLRKFRLIAPQLQTDCICIIIIYSSIVQHSSFLLVKSQ